jgi:uncharacterized DUF497 family protein
MDIEFDPAKSAKNEAERGMPFALVEEFDFDTAYTKIDARFEYAEERRIAYGPLQGRLCAIVYCFTTTGIRIISLRKANKRESVDYEKAKAAH